MKNALTMIERIDLLEVLRDSVQQMEPEDERAKTEILAKITEGVARGRQLSGHMHLYAHREVTVNPDWAAAGLWTRWATDYLNGFIRILDEQE